MTKESNGFHEHSTLITTLMWIASTSVVCRFSLVLSLPRSRFLDVTQKRCVTSKKNDARETKYQAKANCGGVVRFTRVRGRSLSLFSFLCAQHTFFLNISLPLFWTTTTWNVQKLPSYTFYGGNVVCVPVHFFSLPLIFTLVAASISHFLTSAIKFSCFFFSNEIGLPCSLFLALA